jgi:RNA polymerase sigma-70 factor (ECF subfamily)
LNFSPVVRSLTYKAHVSATRQQLYEQMLVLRSQIGDEAAFQELLALYGPQLLRFTRKMIESPETVDDLTQEIWAAIFRGLPGLREVDKFRPWAFRIARDRIYRQYRRRNISILPLGDDELEALPEIGYESPALEAGELQQSLELIPPDQREVLMLRFFEEMSYEEIARVTGCTLGTVRSRIHYAKRALRNALERKMI